VDACREQHRDHPVIGMVVPIVKRNVRRPQTLLRPAQSAVPSARSPRKRRSRTRRRAKK
jgi:hypothetical protein